MDAVVTGLQRIVDAGQWLAIPRILSLVLDRRSEVAEAAAAAVNRLWAQVRVLEMGRLDSLFRELSPHLHPEYAGWRNLQAHELLPLASLKNTGALLSLAMCHLSGYVREEAIALCGVCADDSDLPILLLRTNDWVQPVRERAHRALRTRLNPDHLPALVAALPILAGMRKWGRLGDQRLLEEIDALLRGSGMSELFLTCENATDRLVRRESSDLSAHGTEPASSQGFPRMCSSLGFF